MPNIHHGYYSTLARLTQDRTKHWTAEHLSGVGCSHPLLNPVLTSMAMSVFAVQSIWLPRSFLLKVFKGFGFQKKLYFVHLILPSNTTLNFSPWPKKQYKMAKNIRLLTFFPKLLRRRRRRRTGLGEFYEAGEKIENVNNVLYKIC